MTGYGEMVLAEFNYKNEFTPDPKLKQMLVFNSNKPHWRLWFLKKYMPVSYTHLDVYKRQRYSFTILNLKTMAHYQVLIIGGGTAGIMVASQMMKKNKNVKIAIVEPSDKHYYQPAWTLVGAGAFDYKKTIRPQADYIPKGRCV